MKFTPEDVGFVMEILEEIPTGKQPDRLSFNEVTDTVTFTWDWSGER